MANYDHNSIFVPDMVLASQFFAGIRRRALPDGERRLMVAVLEDGARCFLQLCTSTDPVKRALYEDAEQWLTSADRSGLYAFDNICDVLGIDSDWLRKGLYQGRDRALARAKAGAPMPDDPTAQLCKTG